VLIIVDMIAPTTGCAVTDEVAAWVCLPRERAESGWPFKRRLVIIRHSATACSGEVSRRSLNQRRGCRYFVQAVNFRGIRLHAASSTPACHTPPLMGRWRTSLDHLVVIDGDVEVLAVERNAVAPRSSRGRRDESPCFRACCFRFGETTRPLILA
jgi:hypothetical protein